MPNSKIFCNVPWTTLHMYWDGSFGMCCSESQKPYSKELANKYNIKNMSINDWYQSEAMKKKRIEILGNNYLSECSVCYAEESFGYESKRSKENLKTVIFLDKLENSYKQSHWFNRFESAKFYADQSLPIDWHIDLGNECNLACKMCNPKASSKIAMQFKKWQLETNSYTNWTNDPQSFKNFLESVDKIKIHRLHFMGGEPFFNKKFAQIIDYLIDNSRQDISLSIVTNGTMINLDLIDKLKTFKSFDLEISIESIEANNHYIRQGCDTEKLKQNILFLKSHESENFKVVLRTVPQLLSINTYHKLILWAWENKLSIQGIPLKFPSYLSMKLLPDNLKNKISKELNAVKDYIEKTSNNDIKQLSTGRDTSRLHIQLARECQSLINLLGQSNLENTDHLRKELSHWLYKWDQLYDLNPFEYYPEYKEFFQSINYGKI